MRRDSMTGRLVLGLALVTAGLAGCGKDGGDEFRDGVPQHEDVTLAVPAADGQQSALVAGDGTSAIQAGLLGDRSEMYTLTRAVTGVVNLGTVSVLTLVHNENKDET